MPALSAHESVLDFAFSDQTAGTVMTYSLGVVLLLQIVLCMLLKGSEVTDNEPLAIRFCYRRHCDWIFLASDDVSLSWVGSRPSLNHSCFDSPSLIWKPIGMNPSPHRISMFCATNINIPLTDFTAKKHSSNLRWGFLIGETFENSWVSLSTPLLYDILDKVLGQQLSVH